MRRSERWKQSRWASRASVVRRYGCCEVFWLLLFVCCGRVMLVDLVYLELSCIIKSVRLIVRAGTGFLIELSEVLDF
jgi:hypothetical protein